MNVCYHDCSINAGSTPQYKRANSKKQMLREKGKNDHRIQIFTSGYLTFDSSRSFTPLPKDIALLFQFHGMGETAL